MDIRQLEYFVKIAELGSFTRASAELAIAQPALSRQIRQMEVELRQSLLTRHGRGVALTDAGKVLLEHARQILHQMQRAREDMASVRGGLAGNVSVGMPPAIAKMLAVPLTHAFRERLPEATLSITESLSLPLQDQLIGGHLDIALIYNPAWSPEVDCSALLEEDFYLVTLRKAEADDAPLALRALAAIPLVIPKRGNAIRTLVESRLASIGCKPTIAFEVDGIPAILDLVADGAGSAVLSINAVTTSGRAAMFGCRPLREPRLRSALALATSAHRPVTPTQHATAEMLREMAARLIGHAGAPSPLAPPAQPAQR